MQKVFATFGLKSDPDNPALNLTREVLDNMPVLGERRERQREAAVASVLPLRAVTNVFFFFLFFVCRQHH